jgi:hypothetical protein
MRDRTAYGILVGCVLVILLLNYLNCPPFSRPKAHDGRPPRAVIRMQLEMIDEAKEILKRRQGLPDDYWPTRTQIAIAYTSQAAIAHTTGTNASFDSTFRQIRWGEIYIVNKIGAPTLAYLRSAAGGFPEGYLVTSEDLLPGAQQIGPANGSQPFGSGTNRTSAPADSRRSP